MFASLSILRKGGRSSKPSKERKSKPVQELPIESLNERWEKWCTFLDKALLDIFPSSIVGEIAEFSFLFGGWQKGIQQHNAHKYVLYPKAKWDVFNETRTIVYKPNSPDFRDYYTNFKFSGNIKVTFRILKKSDEMWIGVTEDPKCLEPRAKSYQRCSPGNWSVYCGRRSRKDVIPIDEPKFGKGVRDGGCSSLHFPGETRHMFSTIQGGDTLELAVNTDEGTFEVSINGFPQTQEILKPNPWKNKQLYFWGELDAQFDAIAIEEIDFGFPKVLKN